MSARDLALVLAGAGLALGVTACSSDTDSSAAPAATTKTTAASTLAPVAATSAPATSKPAARPACPVTEADLQKAVKAKSAFGVSPDAKFTKIACYQDYAAATLPERSDSDEAYVVFKYDSAAWTIVSKGSADICPGVPADVIKRFRSAHYGACR